MTTQLAILEILSSGDLHSGEAIASRLGVSRTAVWKGLEKIRSELGIEVVAVRGRGYQLRKPLELLDAAKIRADLAAETPSLVTEIEVLTSTDSTNTRLLELAKDGVPSGWICLAEHQRRGRGRHGRQWVSPFGRGLLLSLLWRFHHGPAGLAGLSLAAGTAVARTIEQAGLSGVALKWPNDLLWRDRKLAGLLIEVAGEAHGPSHAVIGLGLNLAIDPSQARRIDQPWVDLETACGGRQIGRNRLAARLIAALSSTVDRFERDGLAPFLAAWRAFDRYHGKPITVVIGERSIDGIHIGLTENGALRVMTPSGERRFQAGEVTLRSVVHTPS